MAINERYAYCSSYDMYIYNHSDNTTALCISDHYYSYISIGKHNSVMQTADTIFYNYYACNFDCFILSIHLIVLQFGCRYRKLLSDDSKLWKQARLQAEMLKRLN